MESRNALIEANLGRVKIIAKQLAATLPYGARLFEELVGAGNLGLVEAARTYDGRPDCQFGSFAQHRIRGAMLDCLGKLQPEADAELVDAPDGSCAIERDFLVAELLRSLEPRMRRLVTMRYLEDRTQTEVAREFGRSPTWVHFAERAALEKMRSTGR